MEKKKKLLKGILICMGVILLFIILRLSNIEEEEPIQEVEKPSIEQTTKPADTPKEDFKEDNELQVMEFTEKQQEKVAEAFNSFMDSASYQTTLNEGDSILYVSFKSLGTVTFKLYDEYAPDSIDWLEGLIQNNTQIQYDDKRDGGRLGLGTPQFQFITTDRHYNRDEQVPEIFPMKYCLYHIGHSSNNFYFCTLDYAENAIDSYNVPEEYLSYLRKYGGNMSVYLSSIVMGRAVENAALLDQLTPDFELESMTIVRNGHTYTATFESNANNRTLISDMPNETVQEEVEQNNEPAEENFEEEISEEITEEPQEEVDENSFVEENPITEE